MIQLMPKLFNVMHLKNKEETSIGCQAKRKNKTKQKYGNSTSIPTPPTFMEDCHRSGHISTWSMILKFTAEPWLN